ncbi:MAG: hypothetical protein FJ267_04105 [Planctomycetes bacterium]|nr:hypothetical protein [Planctomycetota bacterium]
MSSEESLPSLSELEKIIQRANCFAVVWVLVEVLLVCIVVAFVDWERVLKDPLTSFVVVLVFVGPTIMDILRQTFQKKREIEQLKEETRFGEYDKYRLRRLVDQTLDRLELTQPGPPVYVTPEKSLNAGAFRLGLGGFLRSLNGVYLNRQLLHRLTSAEIQYIIGHELGHYYRYYLLSQRFHSLSLLLGAVLALFVSQHVGLSNVFSIINVLVCGSFFSMISSLLINRHERTIEFLCDSFGARVNGVIVSINSLLKSGIDEEVYFAVLYQQLISRHDKNLSAIDVVEAAQSAIPYGHRTREELEKIVDASIRQKAQKNGALSVKGFLEYAWNGPEEDEGVDEQLAEFKSVFNSPRLPWEQMLEYDAGVGLRESQIENLVGLLESHPHHVLFSIPGEVEGTEITHPATSRRIRFLWKNRKEIESDLMR